MPFQVIMLMDGWTVRADRVLLTQSMRQYKAVHEWRREMSACLRVWEWEAVARER